MSEEHTQQELEQLVEAQAQGEGPAEAEASTEPEPPRERKLDRRKSKLGWFQSPAGQ